MRFRLQERSSPRSPRDGQSWTLSLSVVLKQSGEDKQSWPTFRCRNYPHRRACVICRRPRVQGETKKFKIKQITIIEIIIRRAVKYPRKGLSFFKTGEGEPIT